MHELEIERDEVDGDKGVDGSGSDLGEEDRHFFLGDVMDREDAARECCQDGEGLLEGEENEEPDGEGEQRDNNYAVPGINNTAEGNRYDTRNEGPNLEEGAEVVDFAAAGQDGGV